MNIQPIHQSFNHSTTIDIAGSILGGIPSLLQERHQTGSTGSLVLSTVLGGVLDLGSRSRNVDLAVGSVDGLRLGCKEDVTSDYLHVLVAEGRQSHCRGVVRIPDGRVGRVLQGVVTDVGVYGQEAQETMVRTGHVLSHTL